MKGAIRLTFLAAATLLAACSAPNPPLSLYDRFILVALTDDAGNPLDRLYRWEFPLRIAYRGPERYRDDVRRHAELLAKAAGIPVRYVENDPNMTVLITGRQELRPLANQVGQRYYNRDAGHFSCFGAHADESTIEQPNVIVGIANDLTPVHIRSCIIQEMTQMLGLYGDLDGRTDTNFASRNGARALTEYDLQLLAILYDERLRDLMPRRAAIAVLHFIVADVEAQQEAGR